MNKYDDMGFVTLDELQNVFTVKLARVEEELFKTCPSVERRADQAYIMSWLEGIRLELQKRAKVNIERYLTQNHRVKAEERKVRDEEVKSKNRQSYEDRVRLGRQNFNRTYASGE